MVRRRCSSEVDGQSMCHARRTEDRFATSGHSIAGLGVEREDRRRFWRPPAAPVLRPSMQVCDVRYSFKETRTPAKQLAASSLNIPQCRPNATIDRCPESPGKAGFRFQRSDTSLDRVHRDAVRRKLNHSTWGISIGLHLQASRTTELVRVELTGARTLVHFPIRTG